MEISCKILCIVYYLFGIVVTQNSQILKDSTPNNRVGSDTIAILFDPYVSILDKHNRNRYNVMDLLPLVSLVATKFKRFLIELSDYDLQPNITTSRVVLPEAVANYNKIHQGKGERVEVYLAYISNILNDNNNDDDVYHDVESLSSDFAIDRLTEIAEKANNICNQSVTTLLLPYKFIGLNKLYTNTYDSLVSTFQQWGILLDTDLLDVDYGIKDKTASLRPDVVFFRLEPLSKSLNFLPSLHKETTKLASISNNSNWTLGFQVTFPDTDEDGKTNVPDMVTFWTQIVQYSETKDTPFILSKAFDTPYASSIRGKTNGWWRLRENSSYVSTNDYVFDEKFDMLQETEIYTISQLPENLNFSRDHAEVIFSLYDEDRTKNRHQYSDNELIELFTKMTQKFQKIMILVEDDSHTGGLVFLYQILKLDRLDFDDKFEITVLIMPEVELAKMYEGQIKDPNWVATNFLGLIHSVKSCAVSYTDSDIHIHNTQFVKQLKFKFGYALNISVCSTFSQMNVLEQEKILTAMNDKDLKTIVIYFEESKANVKLGPKRMFQQRIVLFDYCTKFLNAHRAMSSVALKFTMLDYGTTPEFYKSESSIVQFIEYWKMLDGWATENNVTIVLNNAVDTVRVFKGRGPAVPEIGLWRYQGASSENENKWIDKIEDAIFRFSVKNTETLGTTAILLSVLIPFFVSILVISVALILIRRKYRQVVLSSSEIKEFLYGNVNKPVSDVGKITAPQELPYNKSRYEIAKELFTIDDENFLGSGEFGRVCLGEIHVKENIVKVAIKMINPQNVQRSAVSGFLSEIKVLSYVGKHENITELMGANTQDLRIGKVYIFLEFCELGSLEKYLHKLRPSAADKNDVDEVEMMTPEKSNLDARMDKYLNMIALNKGSLDPSVSYDMSRWAREICRGMEYIADKHVVHADLATRNVLLDESKVAKICDFGLSRRMYNYTNYVKQRQEPLPWKWMAPESLRMLQFNEKSDVWAFGVTLWEIYTLGEQPYPGLAWDLQFADMLEGGLRLGKPKYDENDMMYSVMKKCWHVNAEVRPSFRDLLEIMDFR